MKIKIDIIRAIIWFFILIPVSNYYFPKPVYYWPIILVMQMLISGYMTMTIL